MTLKTQAWDNVTWKIPLFKIYWDIEDVNSVIEVITSGKDWAVGSNVNRFEESVAQYFGTKYCVVFNSGTSALHAALSAYGIGKGDEVIVPSFTFVATANAPLFVGAKPIFADIEKESFGLDPNDVTEKVTNATKAILPVHYGGCPCKIKELKEIADDRKLILIEDAAESFGAKIKDKKVGSFGDSAVLSFCQNKILTTGEGGAIVTDSREMYEKLRLIRSHGRLESTDYFASIDTVDYVTLGYNFRMSNITAALGMSQLRKIDKTIEMRREKAEYLTVKLKQEIKDLSPSSPPNNCYHVYQMFTIRGNRRNELMKYLASKGIMTKVYFDPVHLTRFYRDMLKYTVKLPVTEEVSSQVLTLPMYPTLTKEEMDMMVTEIKNFYRVY